MREKRIGVIVDGYLATRHVHLDLPLTCLPLQIPEPGLNCGDRNDWPKLEHSVGALSDLNLRTGLVQPVAATQAWRQRNRAATLDREETVEELGGAHKPSVAGLLHYRQPVILHCTYSAAALRRSFINTNRLNGSTGDGSNSARCR